MIDPLYLWFIKGAALTDFVAEWMDAPTLEVGEDRLMTHKYRGSIVVLSISKSVEPNKE